MRENSFTVKDATTVFMLPFDFDEDYFEHIKTSPIWSSIIDEKSEANIRIDKSAFYPHIHEFLVKNLGAKKEDFDRNKCVIFSLKDNWKEVPEEKRRIAKLFGNIEFEIKTKNKESDREKLGFRFLNEKSKLSSPKLILYPMSSIGLLMFSIEMTEKNSTLDDLVNLNYRLHKINSDQPEIQITLPPNAHEQRVKEIEKIYQSFAEFNVQDEKKQKNNEKHNGWYFHKLLDFLLFNFNKNRLTVQYFNENRFHLFTYLLVDSLEKFENDTHLKKKDLMKDFIRLSRCQNMKYKVLQDDLDDNKTYIQTFENIYVASSVEGLCMMVDLQGTDLVFFDEFKNGTFLSRYLWIYLLVFMQRQTLIELTKKLMKEFDSKNNLDKLLSDLSKIRINSYFTDISDHTQHNTFYRFCSDNLLIKKHLDEVKDKMEGANFILREQIEKREKERDFKLDLILVVVAISQIYFGIVGFYKVGHWLLHGVHFIFGLLVLYLLYIVINKLGRTKK